MSWFNSLKVFFTPDNNPNKVIEVKSEKYTNRHIHCRHEGMILYAPDNNNGSEIVLHLSRTESLTSCYSLYRGTSKEDAEIRFCIFKDKLIEIINLTKDGYNLTLIQGLCDTLILHPTWNNAHLAVHLTLMDTFSKPEVSMLINIPDIDSGLSPLQLAIQNNSLSVVKLLIQLDASLDHLDNESNSIYHYAAKSSKEIIQVFSSLSSKFLNYRNVNGFTPLHLACQADKPDCVKALLVCGADVNIPAGAPTSNMNENKLPGIVKEYLQDNHKKLFVEDMKFGGTPLHWSSSREVIDSLIANNCDLNALNFDKRTALHIMVLRNRFDCVMGLLCHGANVNIPDDEGNTPLHLAVKNNLISMIQALIVFEADLNYINNSGLSARHIAASNDKDTVSDKIVYILHAVGASRCIQNSNILCKKGCVWNQSYNGLPPPKPSSMQTRCIVTAMEEIMKKSIDYNKNYKGGRVLCLDGGGIKGLILISVLLHIENATKVPIIHCFDWLAGTSTGGILALGLACGKSLNECLCLYFRLKQQVFKGSKPYSSEILENMLQETLGPNTYMSDIKYPKILVTGLLADRKPVDLHIFRNYTSPSDMLGHSIPCDYPSPPPPNEQLAWKAARASGAAPSYFRMFGRFLDGGLISNNPTLDVLTEIEEYNLALYQTNKAHEMCDPTVVVSVGTGCIPVSEVKNLDLFMPSSVSDSVRVMLGVSALGALLIDQATQADGRVVDRARAWCYRSKAAFFRFCPQISEDIAMDEKDDIKLVNILWETKVDMVRNSEKVNTLAKLLK